MRNKLNINGRLRASHSGPASRSVRESIAQNRGPQLLRRETKDLRWPRRHDPSAADLAALDFVRLAPNKDADLQPDPRILLCGHYLGFRNYPKRQQQHQAQKEDPDPQRVSRTDRDDVQDQLHCASAFRIAP